jgi:hypothetical protein
LAAGLHARLGAGYAVAVGLDPGDTVDEFCRLYLHGDRRARNHSEIASMSPPTRSTREFGPRTAAPSRIPPPPTLARQ